MELILTTTDDWQTQYIILIGVLQDTLQKWLKQETKYGVEWVKILTAMKSHITTACCLTN